MANTPKDGGPAFPKTEFNGASTPQHGMTLRDYFAGQAMNIGGIGDPDPNHLHTPPATIAERAFRVADAMLKEREK